jgi:hypothetical protein
LRGAALTHSLLTIGLVAFVGSGCGKLDAFLEAVQGHQGGTGSTGAGTAGTSGSSTGAGGSSGAPATCVAEMGPTGLCKRCYDPSGVLVHEDCPPPPTGDDPMCVQITEGGAGSCADYATYKLRSSDVCAQKNLFISRLEPGPACGNGGIESMTFVCCPPPAPTPVRCNEGTDMSGRICKTCVDAGGKVVSTDCNSSVPGMMCVKIPDGGATSCKPYDTWKQYGTDACKQQAMQLTELVVGTTCGAGYQNVTYVCCATIPSGSTGAGGSAGTPSPPAPKCGQTTDASGQICKTCWDSVSGAVISNDCAPVSTGSGGSGGGQTCVAIDDGGPTSCKDAATWKRYGSERCAQQNLALADVKLAIACDGGYSMVSYVCCGAGAAPGPVVSCDSWLNPDGALCKQCRDASGNVISFECVGGQTPPNEICDVKTNADGSQCKTCYYSDGTTVSSCASP